jgi:hypothetical protein
LLSGPGTESIRAVFPFWVSGGGATIMPTAKEYRLEAKACLELADQANEFYVRAAMIELARDYNRAARQIERREHDMVAFSNLQGHSR